MRTLLFQEKTQIFVSVIRLTETDNRIKTLNGRGSGRMDAVDVFVPVQMDNRQSSMTVFLSRKIANYSFLPNIRGGPFIYNWI